jgi:hypothetical protein
VSSQEERKKTSQNNKEKEHARCIYTILILQIFSSYRDEYEIVHFFFFFSVFLSLSSILIFTAFSAGKWGKLTQKKSS